MKKSMALPSSLVLLIVFWASAGPAEPDRLRLQQGKDFERAERYFRKFLTQEPEPVFGFRAQISSHDQTYWRLGQTLEKLNRKTEAVDALKTAVKLDPGLDGAKKDLKRLR